MLSLLKRSQNKEDPKNHQRYQHALKKLKTQKHLYSSGEEYIHRTLEQAPTFVIDRFEPYIPKIAATQRDTAIAIGSLATARDFKIILHTIADALQKTEHIDLSIKQDFIQFTKNNPHLDLKNTKGRDTEAIRLLHPQIKKECYNLIVKYITFLETLRQKTRRKHLRNTGLIIGGALTGKAYSNIDNFVVYEHTLSAGIPSVLDGWAIINLSDIHIHQDNILNVNEPEKFAAYFMYIKNLLKKRGIDESKIILTTPGDFLTQETKFNEQTSRPYAKATLPLLNILPGKYRYTTFGNHDEIHTDTEQLRQWFESNHYIMLDKGGQDRFQYIHLGKNQSLQIAGLPDFQTRGQEISDRHLLELVAKTSQNIFTILLTHNLDSVDAHLPGSGHADTLTNTYIATGHTHRFHINIPIVGELINRAMLDFRSAYYKGRYQLKDNVHIDNCPGLNNSPMAPFRMNANPGATITYLKHIVHR